MNNILYLNPSEERKCRKVLQDLERKTNLAWSFGKLKTFRDLVLQLNGEVNQYYDKELNEPLTFQQVKQTLSDLHTELNTYFWLQKNPPYLNGKHEHDEPIVKDSKDVDIVTPDTKLLKDYGWHRSPNENISFLWFQKKVIAEIMHKILLERKRGIALIAETGSGKTIMAGGVLRRLIDIKFHEGKTYTWAPYVVVTKASVVEQFKRDLKDFFNLGEQDVLVIHYDALRSKFGELFVDEKVTIEGGQEHVKWKWRKNLNPICIVWDEPHSLKNLDSQQSQIGQSFNEIENSETYQVFTGATIFTRVIEAKCFCVATRIMIP